MASTKRQRRKQHAKKPQVQNDTPQDIPVSRSLVSRIVHSAWGPAVSLLLGAVVSISGARSQAAVDVLLGVAAFWTLWVVVTLELTKRLRPSLRAMVTGLVVIALAVTWWFLARRFFLVPPPERTVTPSEIAEAVVKKLPSANAKERPNPSPASTPGEIAAQVSGSFHTPLCRYNHIRGEPRRSQ